MNITKALKSIYRAQDCTDLNDIACAVDSIKDLASANDMNYTPAMRKRLAALEAKKVKILKRDNKEIKQLVIQHCRQISQMFKLK